MPLSGCTRLSSSARFSLRLLDRVADHDEAARQDLDVLRIAPEPRSAALDVGVDSACASARPAAAGEDHLGGLGGELPAGVGGAGLHDDRPALHRPRDVQRTAHRQKLALVVEHMHPFGVEIDAASRHRGRRRRRPSCPTAR